MTAFFKQLDVDDLHGLAPQITQTHSLQAKYPWPTEATLKEAEIHLEQRSEVRSGSYQ